MRWLFPDGPHHNGVPPGTEASAAGVELLPVRSSAPGFRRVQSRLTDCASELVLTKAVRDELPDVVHVLAFGGATSSDLAWLAERLGAPSVISLAAKSSFCHRGTLVNERGEDCVEWDRPERCAVCCLAPFPGGLGSVAAACGRLLARLHVLSPFPNRIDFENRFETVIGGLQAARRLIVAGPADTEILDRAGVRVPTVCLPPPPEPDAVLAVYREAVAGG